ncbi:MAG: hypothetical protein OXT71_06265 [Acidobacteriota bacterium]|nr:hypothetical protein [Acidobacteriota bacterium]
MDYINDYSDERLKGMCAQCGGGIWKENRSSDHVPSKCLLRKTEGPSNNEYPTNLPVIPTCLDCNQQFSNDEEYLFLFLHCVLAGSTDSEDHMEPNVRRALKRHVGMRQQIERSKQNVSVGGSTRLIWTPEFRAVHRVVLKNARGHAYYEYGQPVLTEPEHIWAMPIEAMTKAEHEEFEIPIGGIAPWPEVGSRMMTRVVTGQDMRSGWIVVQDGVYRYRMEEEDGLFVRAVLREYLATQVYWRDY